MAQLNFPASPTLNQTYTVGDTTWMWDGEKWVVSTDPNQTIDEWGS